MNQENNRTKQKFSAEIKVPDINSTLDFRRA